LGLGLLTDAVVRSEWMLKTTDSKMRLRKRVLGMVPIVIGAVVFGLMIRSREKSERPKILKITIEPTNHEVMVRNYTAHYKCDEWDGDG
jgi:hypothetical protein